MAKVVLGENSYGKSSIRLVKVVREGARHEIQDLTVAVALTGDFDAAHRKGDNSKVLPTDTMKNTVYALAARHSLAQPEAFGLVLARHFLSASPAAATARVSIARHGWSRMNADGHEHDHAFLRGGAERRTATVTATREAAVVEAGIADLDILKSSGSAFSGFPRDRYTTLADTEDRILATSLTATWRYATEGVSFGPAWHGVRRTLLGIFADHESKSVQHTLYAMGAAVLAHHTDVTEIRLTMPNKHHLRVDLAPFGIQNDNEIFVATTEPYGLIEGVVRREG